MSKSQSMRWRNLQGNYQYERLQERGSRGKCVYLFYTGIDNTYWIGKSYNPEDTLNTLRKYKPDEFYEKVVYVSNPRNAIIKLEEILSESVVKLGYRNIYHIPESSLELYKGKMTELKFF